LRSNLRLARPAPRLARAGTMEDRGARMKLPMLARCAAILAATVAWAGLSCAETVKIGIVKLPSAGPFFIAVERGYFAAEGITPELVYFTAGQPVAVAVVSGDIDFGGSALTGGLYGLAGQGALKLIGGLHRDAPGFHLTTIVASNQAYEAGLRSFADLTGRSAAISTVGATGQYILWLIAEKYGVDPKTLRFIPLQSEANAVAAVVGGKTDTGVVLAARALDYVQRGEVKRLGWTGDEVPIQIGGSFATPRTLEQRHDLVVRYLRALYRGTKDYHDAFTGPDGTRQDGPSTQAILAIIAKYAGVSPEAASDSIPLIDAQGRLDERDVRRQIAWLKSLGMLKSEVDPDAMIDQSLAVPLPDR
jgi:NitT/TauT family transport system substrate-binding protein